MLCAFLSNVNAYSYLSPLMRRAVRVPRLAAFMLILLLYGFIYFDNDLISVTLEECSFLLHAIEIITEEQK